MDNQGNTKQRTFALDPNNDLKFQLKDTKQLVDPNDELKKLGFEKENFIPVTNEHLKESRKVIQVPRDLSVELRAARPPIRSATPGGYRVELRAARPVFIKNLLVSFGLINSNYNILKTGSKSVDDFFTLLPEEEKEGKFVLYFDEEVDSYFIKGYNKKVKTIQLTVEDRKVYYKLESESTDFRELNIEDLINIKLKEVMNIKKDDNGELTLDSVSEPVYGRSKQFSGNHHLSRDGMTSAFIEGGVGGGRQTRSQSTKQSRRQSRKQTRSQSRRQSTRQSRRQSRKQTRSQSRRQSTRQTRRQSTRQTRRQTRRQSRRQSRQIQTRKQGRNQRGRRTRRNRK